MIKQTASQTVGPFFHHILTPQKHGKPGLVSNEMAAAGSQGERIRVEGRLLDGEGNPLRVGLIEIWQADANGRYQHPADQRREPPPDPAFRGFGRAEADPDGWFWFETVKPGAVPGLGNVVQAPHVNLTIFAAGLGSHLYTRLYFSDEAEANELDPVLGTVDSSRRGTLVAQRDQDRAQYSLDILVGGDAETVFFEV